MKASCVCITYGRKELLEESIQMFLNQDFEGDSEMIIVNDEEGVNYEIESNIDNKVIRIYNVPKRFSSIGSKRTYATNLAAGDIIMPWDDDDILLPNKISTIMNHIKDYDYWQCDTAYLETPNKVRQIHTPGHCAAGFRLDTFIRLGGHYIDQYYDEDRDLKDRFIKNAIVKVEPVAKEEIFFVCRRSPEALYQTTRIPIEKRHSSIEEKSRKQRIKGNVKLKPSLKRDYVSIYRNIA